VVEGAPWFYSDGQAQRGPVERSALELMIAKGEIGGETLVWRDGLPAWMPARQVPELAGRFGASAMAPPAFATASATGVGTPRTVSSMPTPVAPVVPLSTVSAPVPSAGKRWLLIGCAVLAILSIVAGTLVAVLFYFVQKKDDCQVVAETFLRDIAAGSQKTAYESTDAGFRTETKLEDFSEVGRGLEQLGAPLAVQCVAKEFATDAKYGTVQTREYVVRYGKKSVRYSLQFRQDGATLRILGLHYKDNP
jgi:hypothetical protein